jgi:hypothetical protein
MDENQVIEAVCAHLQREGWSIKQRLHTTERGVDIIAVQPTSGRQLYVEAKGGTSSSVGSARYGKPYTQTQVFDRVAKGIFTGLQLVQQYRTGEHVEVALAFPEGPWVRKYLLSVVEPLRAAQVGVFLADVNGSVKSLFENAG